ncbi:IS3 family transposase [Billgrantia montanilacus]|uniref:IS3 family transposase n=2 Tax=Billgrantia montanilacus TaxID=2282305 RepID=A0A368TNX0_9GAMM|nr:IS3 family transposase [Halomonas montanilacus]RCV85927.1 IS3 family transposase [Halomonas montanilacus]
MYSYEDRIRAVELYLKYGKSASAVVRELGYPSPKNLRRWYRTYVDTGGLPERLRPKPKYSIEQKQKAVDHYLSHGRCLARTTRAMGHPCVELLGKWIDELHPGMRKRFTGKARGISLSRAQKQHAVIELCSRQGTASEIAVEVGVSRQVLYKWKDQLLDDEAGPSMKRRNNLLSGGERAALEQEVESLERRIHRLQLEHDILMKANELIKKDQGIDLQLLTNREKTQLIDALRETYTLSELFAQLRLPRSSYFYHRTRLRMPDKHADVRRAVRDIFERNNRCYGYRRIHAVLSRYGTRISEKVVRRLMAEEQVVVRTTRRRRYSSYGGEISPAADNLVDRNFCAAAPNEKWLTDITEFQIPAGKVYLSPMIDCFDGLVVSWTIGTRPDAELVNTMLGEAIGTLDDDERPIVHSDRGAHYRWPGWLSRIKDAKLTRSMSRKGCTPDNAACEGFFGRLKTEFFYHRNWQIASPEQFMEEVDSYIRWYNEKRIKMSLGALSPLEYRKSLGIAA